MWKDSGILTKADFEYIQQEIDGLKVPANVGRIPYKIASNFSGFMDMCLFYGLFKGTST